MKLYLVFIFALLFVASSALVVPNEQVFNDVAFEKKEDNTDTDDIPIVEQSFADLLDLPEEPIEDVMSGFWDGLVDNIQFSETDDMEAPNVQFDTDETGGVGTWITDIGLDDNDDNDSITIDDDDDDDENGDYSEDKRKGCPHHPPHHPSSNLTIYELIKRSKHTTKLAKYIDEDEEVAKLLDSKEANYTFFAPTDYAFSKIPKDAPKPSKEFIRDVLHYHTSPGLYPTGRVFQSQTLPSLLKEPGLGGKLPQRLVIRAGLRGLKVNFYSRVVASNIRATNGLVHGIDSILLPPPKTFDLLNLLPTHFSTFVLGLTKTGLVDNSSSSSSSVFQPQTHHHKEHEGRRTTFAPLNSAFEKLGSKTTTFLFSKHGRKYLHALLQYHISQNRTLYSDVLYTEDGKIEPFKSSRVFTHIDLPTLLKHHGLSIDIARFGLWGSSIRINGFQRVGFADGIAADGVVHVVRHVLIPPRHVGRRGYEAEDDWGGCDGDISEVEVDGEVSIEDLKERLRLNGLVDDEEEEE